MKKLIIAVILLILFIRFVPVWPEGGIWVSQKTHITTWDKIWQVYYSDKVQY